MVALAKPIVLVGMMGCGKSAVGKRLAKAIDTEFVDSDKVIQVHEGMSISAIFETRGEPYFRACEYQTIKQLLSQAPKVIALGGGAFIQDNVRKLIKDKAISVWIDAPLDILVERVSRKNNRPLLENTDKRATLEKLLQDRLPIYMQADHRVTSDNSPHQKVVDRIIAHVIN